MPIYQHFTNHKIQIFKLNVCQRILLWPSANRILWDFTPHHPKSGY